MAALLWGITVLALTASVDGLLDRGPSAVACSLPEFKEAGSSEDSPTPLESEVAAFELASNRDDELSLCDDWNWVAPSSKLAFCRIHKVASMQFQEVLKALNGGKIGHSCSNGQPWPITNLNTSWKVAAFVRDPAERYLSAFKDKCLPKPYGTRTHAMDEKMGFIYARMCGHNVSWSVDSATEAIEAFERRVRHDAEAGLGGYDLHWKPQSQMLRACGMDFEHRDEEHHLIFELVHDHRKVNAEVKSMLAAVHAHGMDSMVDRFFSAHCVSGHQDQSELSVLDYYRSPEILRMVLNLFKEDYRTIGLSLPAWVDKIDATFQFS